MRTRRTERAEEDFQMAPMIDMVFLLLVFFMCVSTLAQADKQAPVDLPDSEESTVPDDLSGRGIISLDSRGRIFIGSAEVNLETMKRRIGAAMKKQPDLRIQLRADRGTVYGDIRRVLKACAEIGAYEVIYATHQAR